MGLRKVTIYDYSRLNFVNTTLSKRKLTWFVDNGYVQDWTDPRFPTVRGILRRGMLVRTLTEFMMEQGPSKSTVLMEWDKIWATNRKNIDPIAGKFTAIEKSKTCLLTLTDLSDDQVVTTHPVHPKNAELGNKPVFHSNKLWLESDDVKNIKEGEKVTLMKFGNVMIEKITPLENGNFDVVGKTMLDDKDYKTTQKFTWLIADEKILTHVRLIEYGHLMTKASLEENDKFEDFVNHNNMVVTEAWADPWAKQLDEDYLLQFERRAYYRVDKRNQTGNDDHVVLDCILIPDGKEKAMNSDKVQIQASELTKGTDAGKKGDKKKGKGDKAAEGGKDATQGADGEKKGPSKKDLKKAEKKAKKADMKAEGGADKKAPENKENPKSKKPDQPKTDKAASKPTNNAKVDTNFSIAEDKDLANIDLYLQTNTYLSGGNTPGAKDAKILEALESKKTTPDSSKYPSLFAWWWTLAAFQPAARELWN